MAASRTNRRRSNAMRGRRRDRFGQFVRRSHGGHSHRMNAYHPRGGRHNARRNVRHNARHNRRYNLRANRRMNYPRRRHNVELASSRNIIGALEKGAYVLGGGVFSRMLTQMVLGTANTGFMGYAGNAVATGLLSVVGNAVRKGSGEFIIYGGAAGILMRFIQDQTPLGKYFNLSGIDSGVGAIIPANFSQPAIFTGQNAMVRVPNGWGPGVMPAAGYYPTAPYQVTPGGTAATAAGGAGQVVRGGMGAPVGRGLYSTGGGRGLYRPA